MDDHQGDTRRVAQGDILELHTSLVNDEEKYFVALIVPFAAGFEPLNPDLKTSNALAKPSESDSDEPTYVQRTGLRGPLLLQPACRAGPTRSTSASARRRKAPSCIRLPGRSRCTRSQSAGAAKECG